MSTRSCHRRPRAFTIVEMMIVVLIVSIAAAMVVARMGDSSVTKLRAAAQVLAADLGYAQVESIGHAASLRVIVFNTNTESYHIATAADPATPITSPVTKKPYSVTFGQGTLAHLAGVGIASVSVGGDAALQFGVYGQLDQATAATITLTCDGRTVVLTIHAVTGDVTIGDIQ